MNTYKIKNITNTLEKRHPNFNSIVIINYVDGMVNKEIRINPDGVVYFTINQLPISVRSLELKGLIQITNHPKLTRKPKSEGDKPENSKKPKKNKKSKIGEKIVETPIPKKTKKEKTSEIDQENIQPDEIKTEKKE